MSRGAALSTEELQKIYKQISHILLENNNEPVNSCELEDKLGIKKSRLSAALKYGRNRLASLGRFPYWIIAGPKGYSRVSDKHGNIDSEKLVAYAIQNVKDINSRVKTQSKLYEYVAANYYDELVNGFKKAKMHSSGGVRLDMNPWEVYKNIMEGYGYEFDDDGYYEED